MNAQTTRKRRDREMARLRRLGLRDVDIAIRTGVTRARVGQILGPRKKGAIL
jgi:hypothetical protein